MDDRLEKGWSTSSSLRVNLGVRHARPILLRLIPLVLILVGQTISNGATKPSGFVQVHGTSFLDVSGKPIFFRGINWSEGWQDEQDMERCKEWGVNLIRVWCDQRDWEKELSGQKAWWRLGRMADWAEKHQVYILPVLGQMEGGVTNKLKPWSDAETKNRITRFWMTVAQRLKTNHYVLGYEPWNEPTPTRSDLPALRQIFQELVEDIRSVDTNHAICIPAWNWSNLDGLNDEIVLKDVSNIFYTFHFYDPMALTHLQEKGVTYPGPIRFWNGKSLQADQNWIASKFKLATAFRAKNHVPVLLGEFGCMGSAAGGSALKFVHDVIITAETDKIPWCYWTYKGTTAFSFPLFFNKDAPKMPPTFVFWDDMFRVLRPYYLMNKDHQ
jgi:hypothetical protein